MGTLAVPHHATSAAVVRHSIADDLAGNDVARASIDDVILVASELVGNAVVHTAPADVDDGDELAVTWELEPTAVVVRVADAAPELPYRRPADQTASGGRGLAIVAALASDWGVHRSDAGKQVWARVPVLRR